MSEKEKQIKQELEADYKVEPHSDAYNKCMSVLDEALSIKPSGVESIQTERENDYGDAKISHESIANFWNEYIARRFGVSVLTIRFDATDVAVMLSLMKVSRLAYKRKHDSFLDFASYADFALQFEDNK